MSFLPEPHGVLGDRSLVRQRLTYHVACMTVGLWAAGPLWSPQESIHSWARRYCMERDEHWSRQHAVTRREREREVPYRYADKDYDLFPRYQVLRAILLAIERLEPADFETERELRQALAYCIRTGASPFTEPSNQISDAAMLAERDAMERAVANVTLADCARLPPLPYRRVLGDDEAATVRARLKSRWGIDPERGWYPMIAGRPEGAEAFQAPWVLNAVPPDTMRRALREHGVQRLWELREGGPDYLLDLELFAPIYDGQEGVWTSEAGDWVLYASHESSLTIGGWLLGVVTAAWPGWREHVYAGWEFEWPSAGTGVPKR